MTPVEVCCLAVETVWVTDGPAGLSARAITSQAQLLAGEHNIVVGSMAKQIYYLQDPDGEIAFGSLEAMIRRAHRQAVAGIQQAVTAAEQAASKVDGLVAYWAAIAARPAWHRMVTTGHGPAGHDPLLPGARLRVEQICGRRGHLVAAALHGVIGEGIHVAAVDPTQRPLIVAWLTGSAVDTLDVTDAA